MSSTIKANITIDDFDAVCLYSNDKQWSTNDPSLSNSTVDRAYHDLTYHRTGRAGAGISFNFQGTDVYLYGVVDPSASISISLDGQSSTLNGTASANRSRTIPSLIYAAHNLSNNVSHSINVTNLITNATAPSFTFDYAQTTVELAPADATLVNTTVEDNNTTALTYHGRWESNSSPVFSGGTTRYTNQSGASVSLSFRGSAVYVCGDANNDHYAFNVTLDGKTTSAHSPLGCGGNFEPHACEKLLPGLQFFAGYLDNTQHNLTITNWVVPSLNFSYFDLDRIVYTTPSSYLTVPHANVPAIGAANGLSGADGASSTPNSADITRTPGLASLALLCLVFVRAFGLFI